MTKSETGEPGVSSWGPSTSWTRARIIGPPTPASTGLAPPPKRPPSMSCPTTSALGHERRSRHRNTRRLASDASWSCLVRPRGRLDEAIDSLIVDVAARAARAGHGRTGPAGSEHIRHLTLVFVGRADLGRYVPDVRHGSARAATRHPTVSKGHRHRNSGRREAI